MCLPGEVKEGGVFYSLRHLGGKIARVHGPNQASQMTWNDNREFLAYFFVFKSVIFPEISINRLCARCLCS